MAAVVARISVRAFGWVVALALLGAVLPGRARAAPSPTFPIANQAFWNYFQHRGGIRTLGEPVSQGFSLGGLQSQLFQRALLQASPDGKVQLHNLLDDLASVQHVGGLTLPAIEAGLIAGAPAVGKPDYSSQMLAFL